MRRIVKLYNRRVKAGWAVPILLLAGCKGAKPAQDTSGWATYAQALSATPGTYAYSDPDLGLSILMPNSYKIYDETDAARKGVMQAVREVNPELGNLVFEFWADNGSSIVFFDTDPDILRSGILADVAIGVDSLPEPYDPKKAGDASGTSFSLAGEEMRPLGKVVHLIRIYEEDSITKGRVQMQDHVYTFGRERVFWTVHFKYPTDAAKVKEPVVEAMLDSIRLFKPNPDRFMARLTEWRKEVDKAKRQQLADDKARHQAEMQERLRQDEAESARQAAENPPPTIPDPNLENVPPPEEPPPSQSSEENVPPETSGG